jgi:hypothetical protein
MNLRIAGCLAFVCCGALVGCSTASRQHAEQGGGQAQKAPIPDPILERLDVTSQVRASAESWEKLVAEVKPTFAWQDGDGGCNLMWVRDDHVNPPYFELDRAFGYQAEGGKLQWVLLKTPLDASMYSQVNNVNVYGRAMIVHEKPSLPGDSRGAGEYALVVASDQNHGTVYEIGWEGIMGEGTGHPLEEKRIYVLQDKSGQWRLLGEGPSEGRGGSGGGIWGQSFVTAKKVHWNPVSSSGVEIMFTCENVDSEVHDGPESDIMRRDRIEYLDGVLDGHSKTVQWASHPYMVAQSGESFEGLVYHLSTWTIGWDGEKSGAQAKIERFWHQALVRLNPRISTGIIPKGSKVYIPTYSEILRGTDNLASSK